MPNQTKSKALGDPRGGCVPFTRAPHLVSFDGGCGVSIYGERVANVTDHPAFRCHARIISGSLRVLERRKILSAQTKERETAQHFFHLARDYKNQLTKPKVIGKYECQMSNCKPPTLKYKGAFE
jgi:4-hydroxyphenylacetate 3-monooxygenase